MGEMCVHTRCTLYTSKLQWGLVKTLRKVLSFFVCVCFYPVMVFQLVDCHLSFLQSQVTGSMAGVVKSMDSALKSMNLEKASSHVVTAKLF